MPEIKFISQSIVVLGSLNPAIIQPSWLTNQGWLDSQTKVDRWFPVGEVIAPVKFKFDQYEWLVDYKSLQITTTVEGNTKALGKYIQNIFESLGHTPVNATGHNFLFYLEECSSNLLFLGDEKFKKDNKIDLGTVCKLQNVVEIKTSPKSKIVITGFNEKMGIQFNFNFHYDLSNTKELTEISGDIESNFDSALNLIKGFQKSD